MGVLIATILLFVVIAVVFNSYHERELAHGRKAVEFENQQRLEVRVRKERQEVGHDPYSNEQAFGFSKGVAHPNNLSPRPTLSQVLALALLRDEEGEYVRAEYVGLLENAADAVWIQESKAHPDEMRARMMFFWPQLGEEARRWDFTPEPEEPYAYRNLTFDGVLCMLECEDNWSREQIVAWVADQNEDWNAPALRPLRPGVYP